MSLSELAGGLSGLPGATPFRQDIKVGGNVFCNSVICPGAGLGGGLQVQDQVQGSANLEYDITGGGEQFDIFQVWGTWNASYAYPQGALVRYNGATWGRTGAGASVPGAVPSGPNGWTQQVAPAPTSDTTLTPIVCQAFPNQTAQVAILETPAGQGLLCVQNAAGVDTAYFGGAVQVGTDPAPTNATPSSGGCFLEWDTQKVAPTYPAPYDGQHLGWTEFVNADGSAVADGGGYDFFTGANAQGTPLYLASITSTLEGAAVVGNVLAPVVACEGLRILPATKTAASTFGTATLVGGTILVNTAASDANALIFISPISTGVAPAPPSGGAAVPLGNTNTFTKGSLEVLNQGAAGFTIQSVNPDGTLCIGDVRQVRWWIVNPNWA